MTEYDTTHLDSSTPLLHCRSCGVMVSSRERHAEWHAELTEVALEKVRPPRKLLPPDHEELTTLGGAFQKQAEEIGRLKAQLRNQAELSRQLEDARQQLDLSQSRVDALTSDRNIWKDRALTLGRHFNRTADLLRRLPDDATTDWLTDLRETMGQ